MALEREIILVMLTGHTVHAVSEIVGTVFAGRLLELWQLFCLQKSPPSIAALTLAGAGRINLVVIYTSIDALALQDGHARVV